MRKLVKVVCVCCVAGVFSALACNFSKAPDDPQIVEAIKSQLFDHPELKSRNVSVASSEGVVTLSGQVKSQSERLRVEEIARQVPGVEEVRDSLEVVEDQPKAARATPAPPPPFSESATRRERGNSHGSARGRGLHQRQTAGSFTCQVELTSRKIPRGSPKGRL